MATVEEFWRPIINDFNPIGQVRPEEVARFFVDRKENDPFRSVVTLWKQHLRNSVGQPRPYKALLTGHSGSGKSSELMRLGLELADDYFVVWLDGELTLVTETTNQFDILLAIGSAIYATAHAAGLNPSDAPRTELEKSLAKLVRKFEGRKRFSLKGDQLLRQVFAMTFVAGAVAAGGLPAVVPAGAFALGVDRVLRTARLELNVRDEHVRTLELPPNRAEVLDALNGIIEDVQTKAAKPLLLILDGLDKVPPARAQLLFADSVLLSEPACALVYAAPIEFYHRLQGGQARNLFNHYEMLRTVVVQKRPLTGEHWQLQREPNNDGLVTMRKLVMKRLEIHGLTVDEVIDPTALNTLAQTSGGIMREFVGYMQEAATLAQLRSKNKIDLSMAEDVVKPRRQEAALRLTTIHREALRSILQQGQLTGRQPEIEEALLRGLYLLSYRDDDNAWFDAHPNVLPLL